MSESFQDTSTIQESRFLNSPADRMYQSRHGFGSSTGNPDSTQQDSESEDDSPEIYARVDHVLTGLQSLLPSTLPSQFGILAELMRGMRRDISLVPEEQVQSFMRQIGQACIWIADGSMADLTNPDEESEDAGIRGDHTEEG
jgi:hypothetical protein